MKRFLLIILSLGAVLGCDDFLEETPETFQTAQDFFNNEQQLNEAVAGVYSLNRQVFNDEQWRFGENRSDNTSFQFNPADRGNFANEQIDLFLMTASNGTLGSYWNSMYTGIARANFVLQNLDAVEFADENNRNSRRGEVLFLRSWFYFNLVQLFGDVPFVTSAGGTPDEIITDELLERVPAAQIYDSILTDTQTAIDLLPLPGEAETGRANRGAALMLKAKMHMVLQQFEQAIPLLEEMPTLGYALLENYSRIFAPDNKHNSELVLEIEYSFDLRQPSDFMSRFVPFNSGSDILGGGGPVGTRGGQNQPTLSLINVYDTTDARFLHNISFYEDSVTVEPWMSKYDYGFADPQTTEQNVNLPMFRYADALLMLAECYHEAGGGDPLALLTQVRARSLPDPTLPPDEAADLDLAIANERRRELAFENHRWFDLLRTGRAVEVMTAHGEQQKAQKPSVPAEAYTNIRTQLGIPLGQIQQFDIEQTPGWETP